MREQFRAARHSYSHALLAELGAQFRRCETALWVSGSALLTTKNLWEALDALADNHWADRSNAHRQLPVRVAVGCHLAGVERPKAAGHTAAVGGGDTQSNPC